MHAYTVSCMHCSPLCGDLTAQFFRKTKSDSPLEPGNSKVRGNSFDLRPENAGYVAGSYDEIGNLEGGDKLDVKPDPSTRNSGANLYSEVRTVENLSVKRKGNNTQTGGGQSTKQEEKQHVADIGK